jgi:hypothetical protein
MTRLTAVPAVKDLTPRLMSSTLFGLFAGLSYRFSGGVLNRHLENSAARIQ